MQKKANVFDKFMGSQWALPHLLLYYEPVRLPHRHTSFSASFPTCRDWKLHYLERHGSPKFRCEPLNDPPWTPNPACLDSLRLPK